MSGWRKQAACLGLPLDLFFPKQRSDDESVPDAIRAVCSGCPVAMECLEFALSMDSNVGIWAATTPKQREAIRRYRAEQVQNDIDEAIANPEMHGTMAMFSEHRKRGELPCRACKDAKNAYEANRRRGGYVYGARTK